MKVAINLTRITSNIDITLNTDIKIKLFYINAVSAVLSNVKRCDILTC